MTAIDRDTFELTCYKQDHNKLSSGSVWRVVVLDPSGRFVVLSTQILASSSDSALAKASQYYPGWLVQVRMQEQAKGGGDNRQHRS